MKQCNRTIWLFSIGMLASKSILFGSQPPAANKPIPDTAALYQSLEDALKAKFANATKRGDLPDTLLLLSIIVDDAKRKGEKAPDYNLCDLGSMCKDNKGIKRIDMPQLSGRAVPGSKADQLPKDKNGEVDAKEQFANYLVNSKKYYISDETVPLKSLKATQNELVGSKVAGISFAIEDPTSDAAKDIANGYLFISKDNYILDGHHRWAALVGDAVRKGTIDTATIKVRRIHAPILNIVNIADKWAADFGFQAAAGLAPATATPAPAAMPA